MKHFVPHDISPELAHRAIDKAFESYSAKYTKYAPQMSWRSDRHADISFNAKGITISGSAEVEDKGISFDLKVPLVLSMFKNTALRYLEQEALRWIAQAKAGAM